MIQALKITIGVICTTSIMVISSCGKGPEPVNPTNPDATEKLYSIRTGNAISVFKYNTAGKLAEIMDSLDTSPASIKTKLDYTGGKLAMVTYGLMTYRFENPDEQTIVVWTGSAYDPALEKDVYSFQDGKPTEQVRYYVPANQPEVKFVFIYNSNGNLAFQETYGFDATNNNWIKESITRFVYDEKPNGTGNAERRLFFLIAKNASLTKNNPLRVDWLDAKGKLLRTHQFRYEYDAKGQKTKRTEETIINGQVTNTETSRFIYG